LTDIDDSSAPEIVLDISRLLSRILDAAPTGVDRVEMAYARGLLAAVPDRLSFAAVHPTGYHGRLSTFWVKRYLAATEKRWVEGNRKSIARWKIEAFWWLVFLGPRRTPRRTAAARIYLQSSPHHLDQPKLVERILKREDARLVCLVHDLIPIEHPEYTRPEGAADHRRRIDTIVRLASGIVTNSAATARALAPFLEEAGRSPVVAVAPLGTHHTDTPPPPPAEPYFLCVGTIEPRKNHLLLLNIWRRLAEKRADADLPRLIVAGRRGWENENVIDMLERCPAIVRHVTEENGLSDAQLARLMAGARALLLPSFAEGYGMPVAEALQAGVPVICSDLPALREVGGDVPEYLDPLDGLSWIDAIEAYATPNSARHAAQRARMAGWEAPDWPSHVDIVRRVVRTVAE
jgi:glycosyltransferase involved in cell wall biosynthesis